MLHKTLGVPLFQEQAMRIAIEAAKFTPEEANGLRRAMATFRNVGTIGKFEDKMIGNMIARGYAPEFAKNCFEQIKGFGSYGFPESHAASFAQLVYISSWLKHYHPDAFCCGLLNSQPMGFYAPAQIVGDARTNGVEVREIDVSCSFAQNTLEQGDGKYCAVRLGFRQIDGFSWVDEDEERLKQFSRHSGVSRRRSGAIAVASNPEPRDSGFDRCRDRPGMTMWRSEDWADRIVAARNAPPLHLAGRIRPRHRPAKTRADPARRRRCLPLHRARPPRGVVGGAAAARRRAAAAVSGGDRPRAARRERKTAAGDAAAGAGGRRLPDNAAVAEGPPDGIFAREVHAASASSPAGTSTTRNDKRRISCAGVVLVRQRPGSAKGVVFMTLEDETGIANIVVWPKVMEQYRKEVMGARLILVEGYIQSSPEHVTHLVAQRMFDRSHDLIGLANDAPSRKHPVPAGPALVEPLNDDRRDHPDNPAQKIRHPRDVRILPPSRDFH